MSKDKTIVKDIKHCLADAMKCIDRNFNSENEMLTGFSDYDDCTGGLHSELIVLGGRPGMGKTSLAMNIVEQVVIKNRMPVLVFSLDMPKEAITLRLISSLTGIDLMRLITGNIVDAEWPLISSVISMLAETNLHICDKIMDIFSIADVIRNQAKTHGNLGLIVIDSLQMIANHDSDMIRNYNIQEILIALKAISRKNNTPVLLLTQLSRSNLESRADKRPVASDIPDCDSIESMADKLLFLYRDEIYYPNSPDKDTAELILAKNKMGVECKFRLKFTPHLCRFENFTRSNKNEQPR